MENDPHVVALHYDLVHDETEPVCSARLAERKSTAAILQRLEKHSRAFSASRER